MKFVIALFALVAVAAAVITDEDKANFRTYYTKCVEQTGADKELIKKARKNEYDGDDAKLNAYYTCMFTKVGFFDHNGHLKQDVLLDKIPADINNAKGIEDVKSCSHAEGVAHDLLAKHFMFCMYKKYNVNIF